jgi:hypothetical protein
MPLFYTIDRFDGPDWVVLENDAGKTFSVPRTWLPLGAKEGDVIRLDLTDATHGSELRFTLDAEATAKRQREAAELRRRLPRGPKGDLSL